MTVLIVQGDVKMKDNSVLVFSYGNMRIRVSLKGFWSYGNAKGSPLHSHANFEFHIPLLGEARFETEQKQYVLRENDAVLVFPYAFHRFSNQEKECAVLSFSFSVELTKKENSYDYYSILHEQINSGKDVIIIEQTYVMADYLKKIMANVYSRKIFAREETKALFMLLFTQLLSHFSEMEGGEGDDDNETSELDTRVYMIEEYFNEYYAQDISLKKLSELLFLSEKQTERIIKKYFGLGFKQYLCKTRLKIAQNLLKDSKMEVKQVAEAVGYQSYNGFYLAFKKSVGCTPVEYREAYIKNGTAQEDENKTAL